METGAQKGAERRDQRGKGRDRRQHGEENSKLETSTQRKNERSKRKEQGRGKEDTQGVEQKQLQPSERDASSSRHRYLHRDI